MAGLRTRHSHITETPFRDELEAGSITSATCRRNLVYIGRKPTTPFNDRTTHLKPSRGGRSSLYLAPRPRRISTFLPSAISIAVIFRISFPRTSTTDSGAGAGPPTPSPYLFLLYDHHHLDYLVIAWIERLVPFLSSWQRCLTAVFIFYLAKQWVVFSF